MIKLHQGSCLCGAVTFEVAGPLHAPDACHCTQCRKQTGHFLTSTDVPRASLKLWGDDMTATRVRSLRICKPASAWDRDAIAARNAADAFQNKESMAPVKDR